MKEFVKIYSTILDSSVWGESKDVKLLWITMLAMGGEHGLVEASVGGLARRAGLTREECEAALDALMSPDPDDKSGVDEGRRIFKTDRGWGITNHKVYRDFRTDKQVSDSERQQRKRERDRQQDPVVTRHDVTPSHAPSRPVGPDAERDSDPDTDPKTTETRAGARETPVAAPNFEAPENRSRATPCPMDLHERLMALGVHLELAQHLRCDPESVAAELRAFRDTWVVGKLAGQSRSHWAGKARQWVIDQHRQGKLKPPGQLEHESHGGSGPSRGVRAAKEAAAKGMALMREAEALAAKAGGT